MTKKMKASIIICLIIILLGAISGASQAIKHTAEYKGGNAYIVSDKPQISAHRAGSLVAPENTLMAFEYCLSQTQFTVDIFEFDLHITSDGELILLHDDELDRTANVVEVFGKEEIMASDYTYEQLSALNMGYYFKDEAGNYPYRYESSEAVPSNLRVVKLETVLDYLAEKGSFNYIIEIKNGDEAGKRATDKLYSVLSERSLLDKVIIGTFHGEISAYMDETYPQITRSAGIFEVLDFYFCYLFNFDLDAKNLGYEVLQVPIIPVLDLGTKGIVDYAHGFGLAVQYWTINDAKDIAALSEVGADCIITDSPDVAYDVIYGEKAAD